MLMQLMGATWLSSMLILNMYSHLSYLYFQFSQCRFVSRNDFVLDLKIEYSGNISTLTVIQIHMETGGAPSHILLW